GYFLMMDSEGNLSRVPVNRIANVVILDAKSDLNADELLTNGCTVYASSGDMRNHSGAYDNFPKEPEGGFTLIAVKEGGRVRQFWSGYNSRNLYVRYQSYSSALQKSVWSSWILISENS
ncbi:MAG: hypothetical protein K2M69_03445, partial [Muribaculaceae bacterium]|nr:hypothetical protein [Muribaculaceae bacterium]